MKRLYEIIFVQTMQEFEDKKEFELARQGSCFKTLLPCDCVIKQPHKPAIKVWDQGNDKSLPDRAYVVCGNCSKGLPYIDEAYKKSLEMSIKTKKK